MTVLTTHGLLKEQNSTFYPSAQINIFNRFGKVVAQIDVDNPGWGWHLRWKKYSPLMITGSLLYWSIEMETPEKEKVTSHY